MVGLGVGGDTPLNRSLDALRSAVDGKLDEAKRCVASMLSSPRCGRWVAVSD